MASFRAHLELTAAVSALVVSLTTLGVYLYQAKVMGEQQRVSVWPYVAVQMSNAEGFRIEARNKGVGPALIAKVEMAVDGKPVASNAALISAVLGPEWNLKGFLNTSLEGRVLSPGESYLAFHIVDPAEGRAFQEKLRSHRFELSVTYTNVYGDAWRCTGDKVVRLKERQPSLY